MSPCPAVAPRIAVVMASVPMPPRHRRISVAKCMTPVLETVRPPADIWMCSAAILAVAMTSSRTRERDLPAYLPFQRREVRQGEWSVLRQPVLQQRRLQNAVLRPLRRRMPIQWTTAATACPVLAACAAITRPSGKGRRRRSARPIDPVAKTKALLQGAARAPRACVLLNKITHPTGCA